jgi:hypothetical protein
VDVDGQLHGNLDCPPQLRSTPTIYSSLFIAFAGISHGDQARASAFAERGFRSGVMCDGEDSPETQRIKSLRENPTRHRNFGPSNRWKTAKGLVPKGLDTDGFEKWLWRQGR